MQVFKKYFVGITLLILLVIASVLIYLKLHPKQLPPNLIEGVGRIDGDLVNINTKYPGRVAKLFVDEGENIKKGDLLAILGSKEYEEKKRALEATIKAKNKEIDAKEVELDILEETLPENVKKALEDIGAKEAAINELQKSIETLEKVVSQDKRDLKRLKDLYSKNLIQKHKIEEIELKLTNDINSLKSLKEKRKQLIALLNVSKSTLAQAKSTLKKIEALKIGISALKEAINALKAQKKEVEAVLEELQIKSFIDGYIVEKIALPGEVVGAGMSVYTAIDPKTLYLKIFVDTINNGKIKLGDKAVIFLDAYPDMPIEAKVTKIAKKAEFTPKEVAVRSDRIQRVYAVHLKPIKPNPLLKLGIPATGVISLDGKNLPKSLKDIPEL